MPWEEVGAHLLQAGCGKVHSNLLIARGSIWILQAYIKVSDHQHLCPTGSLADGRNDVLYGRGVIWGNIAPHEITLLPYCHHTEVDNIWVVEVK